MAEDIKQWRQLISCPATRSGKLETLNEENDDDVDRIVLV